MDAYQDADHARVIAAIDGTPASRAGIKSGDLIVAVDVDGERCERHVAGRGSP